MYLISRVRNGKSENCVPFDHFFFFKSSACTRYKGDVRHLDKKKIGKRFENDKRHPSSGWKNPYHYLSVHPNRVFWAKFKKKRKFDSWNTKEQITPRESNIEIVDIAWLCGNTKFLFQCWKVFYEWAQQTSKIFCNKGCLLLYKHKWNTKPFRLSFFAAKGAIHCATIASLIFSFVKFR